MILSGLLLLPEALSFEFDAVGVVDEAIEDRVGDGGVAAIASASEKKVCRRSRPRISVWAKRTPASTFALAKAVNCKPCGYDLPKGTNHAPLSSALRARVHADLPTASLG